MLSKAIFAKGLHQKVNRFTMFCPSTNFLGLNSVGYVPVFQDHMCCCSNVGRVCPLAREANIELEKSPQSSFLDRVPSK